ncbi:MAG TPA: cation-translocating P-type ATPase C-terminal domain-containing protein, partial [Planctomycetota bacterium]|nr:cation-translocating P-type ATPase C-terminal domain-containing protein [Planctomycetota bacterium]
FALAARSATEPAARLGLLTNGRLLAAIAGSAALQVALSLVPPVGRFFHAQPHGAADWGIIAACTVAPFAVVEVAKALRVRRPLAGDAGAVCGGRTGSAAAATQR